MALGLDLGMRERNAQTDSYSGGPLADSACLLDFARYLIKTQIKKIEHIAMVLKKVLWKMFI